MTEFAPVALFVYARRQHTQRTVDALKANTLARSTDLHIFADASQTPEDWNAVGEVRDLANAIEGFRSVTVHERSENFGLAKNIVDGVGTLCRRYGRVIVLEDDLVTSPHFLVYMNRALDHYRGEPRVWHVNAWHFPISAEGLSDTFFSRWMNCWGWATWADRWDYFSRDPERLISDWSHEQIGEFNLDGARPSTWRQVVDNANRRIDTWAVFWHATVFEQDGLCINPSRSLVENIGLDGSGQNCGTSSFPMSIDSTTREWRFETDIHENAAVRERVKAYLRRRQHLSTRAVNKLARMALGRPVY